MHNRPSFQIIVQARIGSERLPGKSMRVMAGKAMLQHVLDALCAEFNPSEIVLATTVMLEDASIEHFCKFYGVRCFRGDAENVASRFAEILTKNNTDCFFRINGDSPLIDPSTLVLALEKYINTNVDLVTTVSKMPYPSGMHVELVNTSSFLNAYKKLTRPEHFEHVTRYFYQNKDSFQIKELECTIKDASKMKFSVDVEEDFLRMEKIFYKLQKPHYEFSLEEKCAIYRQLYQN